MKKLLFFFFLIGMVNQSNAQESDNSTSPNRHQLGVNATAAFRLLLGNSNVANQNPYVLMYKTIGPEGKAFRLGLGGKMEQSEDSDTGRKVQNNGVDLLMGYEKRWELSSPKWIGYIGVDFFGGFHNIKTENDNIKTSSRDWEVGTGPVFGIQWMLSPQVGLHTETALYYRHRELIDEVEFQTFDDNKVKSNEDKVNFILPSALYLSITF